MSVWRQLTRGLANLSSRSRDDQDTADEVAQYLEQTVADGVQRGLAPDEALRAARLELGGETQLREELRRYGWERTVQSFLGDLRYAARGLRRSPVFALAAVATIALGVGANTAVFSVLNVLLLQPLDAARPTELVRIYTSEGHAFRSESDLFGASSYADFTDLRHSGALAGLAAYMPFSATVAVNDALSRVDARVVSDEYFAVLGRPLVMGSWMGDSDPARAREVVVSYGFWSTALGADPSAIGRTILLNGRHRLVVAGVTSREFRGIELSNIGLYLSFATAAELLARADLLTERGERTVRLVGRLAPGNTVQSAEQSLNGVMKGLAVDHPSTNASRVVSARPATSIIPIELMGSAVLPTAGLIFAATLVMLAIAAVNVAGLLLARTIRRRRELAVRLSLGASRARIIRQLVTENLVLAAVAGAAVVLVLATLPYLASTLGVPVAARPTVDLWVLGYTAAVALTVGTLFGVAPAVIGTRTDVVDSLRDSGATAMPQRARTQSVLVCAQLALSTFLLVVSAALLVSLDRQQRVDPGFRIERLIVAQFEDPEGTADRGRAAAFTELALARLGALQGVASVSVGSMAPMTSDGHRSTIHIPGYTEGPDENMEVATIGTGPDFFRTLGIPLVRGRERTPDDRGSAPLVVINRLMARRYWGDADPVGAQVWLGGPRGVVAEVIGVAADARFRSLAEPPQPMYFVQQGAGGGGSVLIRTRDDPAALLLAVRGAMGRNDVPFTLVQLRTMEEVLRSSLSLSRAISQVLLALGIMAILLASVGLYGVVSYVTAGRTHEFGVRLALGATPASITRLVLGYGMRLALIGGVIGVLLGAGTLRAIESLLFGGWASAPVAAVVVLVLGVVTLVACAVPAVRATAVTPAMALRAE